MLTECFEKLSKDGESSRNNIKKSMKNIFKISKSIKQNILEILIEFIPKKKND